MYTRSQNLRIVRGRQAGLDRCGGWLVDKGEEQRSEESAAEGASTHDSGGTLQLPRVCIQNVVSPKFPNALYIEALLA
eukprot:2135928-Amphidinium_carterae.1